MGMMKPKPARSAYIFFSTETVTKLLSEEKELSMTEAAKKAGALWGSLTEEQKAKYVKAHEDDQKRYQAQCEELKTNGFFMLEDGRKSCDVAVKVKKSNQAPAVKTRDRGTQTLKEPKQPRARTESPEKIIAGKKRPRSDKHVSPDKVMRELSFGGTETPKIGQLKRPKKTMDINDVMKGSTPTKDKKAASPAKEKKEKTTPAKPTVKKPPTPTKSASKPKTTAKSTNASAASKK